jgi:hypothetical protein
MLARRRKFWKSASFLCCASTTLLNKGEYFFISIYKKTPWYISSTVVMHSKLSANLHDNHQKPKRGGIWGGGNESRDINSKKSTQKSHYYLQQAEE